MLNKEPLRNVSHFWGEKTDFDWDGLSEAIEFIRIGLLDAYIPVHQAKEKYGTARIYCHFGIANFFWFCYPNYVFYQWKGWVKKLDYAIAGPFFTLFQKYIVRWQADVYRHTYEKAVYLWPHLKNEILCCADFSDLLKGI